MPRIIGKSTNVVKFQGLTINELAGNVASNEDTISIAHVTVSEPTSEPWLTLDYDEWICILKGTIVFNFDGGTLEAHAGDTVFVGRGERFRPIFPKAGVEYVPVCLPAFRPDRCIREDDVGSTVSQRLTMLHSHSTTHDPSDTLYHMCPRRNGMLPKRATPPIFLTPSSPMDCSLMRRRYQLG